MFQLSGLRHRETRDDIADKGDRGNDPDIGQLRHRVIDVIDSAGRSRQQRYVGIEAGLRAKAGG